jgi:hypothetical protein
MLFGGAGGGKTIFQTIDGIDYGHVLCTDSTYVRCDRIALRLRILMLIQSLVTLYYTVAVGVSFDKMRQPITNS